MLREGALNATALHIARRTSATMISFVVRFCICLRVEKWSTQRRRVTPTSWASWDIIEAKIKLVGKHMMLTANAPVKKIRFCLAGVSQFNKRLQHCGTYDMYVYAQHV